MHAERIEAKWIDAFERVFGLCRARRGENAAILSETQSRAVLVQLADLALARTGAVAFHVVVPSPPATAPVPVRSTGARAGRSPATPPRSRRWKRPTW